MSTEYEIYQIAATIAAQNKTPTVALIKSRLTTSVPLTQIIKGLQSWKNNPVPPEKPVETLVAMQPIQLADAQLEAAISKAVAPLIAEIASLKKRLQILEAKA